MLSALVVCGGKSSRMGRPKALLAVRGRRLIDHVTGVARRLASEVLLVTPSPEGLEDLGFPIATGERPGLGPLEALRVGLEQARGDLVYVFSCDLPNIEAGPLKKLQELLDDSDAVIPRSAHGLEPLCALYRKSCAEVFAAQLAKGERALHGAARALRAAHPAARDLGVEESFFANLNMPEDLTRLDR